MKLIPFSQPLVLALLASAGLLVTSTAVATSTKATLVGEPNPAAPGFLVDESDTEAIALADRVMLRMGGRNAWDATRFVTWKFFGNRFHVWDKHTGDIRVEGTDRETKEPFTILMNMNTKEGRAWRIGTEVTDEADLAEMLERGESAWINDAYWMFMPYKLKDTGVALAYRGEGELLDGRAAEVLELTFREVGRTPENKYLVYVAKETGLVEQWDFFANASDEEPRFQVPWRNWRRYGTILLSDDRGRGRHTDIAVFDELPPTVLTLPIPVDFPTGASADPGPTPDLTEAPIYAVEGDVVRPRALNRVPPEYPKSAKEARITGAVVVEAVIGSDGVIRDAHVLEPLEESLDQAALDAVRQWTFDPATLNGEPVAVYYHLTINFRLDSQSLSDESKEESNSGNSR